MNLKKFFLKCFVVLFSLFLGGCGYESLDFSQYESGEKIVLTESNYNSFISVKAAKFEAVTKKGLYNGIAFKYVCKGNEVFSYFNVTLTVKVHAMALQDSGEYTKVDFVQSLFLDESGYNVKHDTYKFGTSFRHLKDIDWYICEVSGYIVKK